MWGYIITNQKAEILMSLVQLQVPMNIYATFKWQMTVWQCIEFAFGFFSSAVDKACHKQLHLHDNYTAHLSLQLCDDLVSVHLVPQLL